MMKIYKTYFNEKVKLIKLKKFKDNRGFFIESFNSRNFNKLNIKDKFVQDNESLSKHLGTIRGLHFQRKPKEQAKLISVKNGSIFDVFVDIRKNSKTFGQYKKVILKSSDDYVLYIPCGFAHGFCTLEKNTIVTYKISNFYSPKHEITLNFDDSKVNVKWPNVLNSNHISIKDKKGLDLSSIEKIL